VEVIEFYTESAPNMRSIRIMSGVFASRICGKLRENRGLSPAFQRDLPDAPLA
jgi:hypothetical protein